MNIEIHERITQQPNGDRDTQRHPSSAFKVVLINGNKTATLFQNSQFDNFHCHIRGTRKEYLAEAQKEAKHFAETMGCDFNLEPTTIPDEITELQARIKHDQAKLKKLLAQRKAG